ncbi:MAG: HAD family hydrolase [Lachnospiraceae bacterium]|nr:HAD family hydrolase [Lachnospiraceae bacterium]
MIKTVIFDVDNTLYSYTEAHKEAFKALTAYAEEKLGLSQEDFEKLHQDTEKELRAYMGNVAALHNRCIRYQVMLERRGIPLYPHVLKMNDLYWNRLLEAAEPSDGALDTIKALKGQGIRIGIGTDMTARVQFLKLETLGILPYVDFLVSSEEAGAEKPEQAFFARCVEKAGCGADECFFVGDNLTKDVLGAVDAGLHGVWYCPKGAGKTADVLQITELFQLLEKVSAW